MFRGVPGKWKNHNRNVRWLLWKLQFMRETHNENEDKSEKLSSQGLFIAQVLQRLQSHGWLGRLDGMFSKSPLHLTYPSGNLFGKGEETVGSSANETLGKPIHHGQRICMKSSYFSRLFTDARHDISSLSLSWCLMSFTKKTFDKMAVMSRQQRRVSYSGSKDQLVLET